MGNGQLLTLCKVSEGFSLRGAGGAHTNWDDLDEDIGVRALDAAVWSNKGIHYLQYTFPIANGFLPTSLSLSTVLLSRPRRMRHCIYLTYGPTTLSSPIDIASLSSLLLLIPHPACPVSSMCYHENRNTSNAPNTAPPPPPTA